MEILSYLTHPTYFYSLLGAIFIIALFVSLGSLQRSLKLKNKKGKDINEQAMRVKELEAELLEKEGQYKQGVSKLESFFKAKEEDFKKRLSAFELQLRDLEQFKNNARKLESQLKEKEDGLKAGALLKADLDKKIKDLESELDRIMKELALKTQMHEGLKSQYDELEKTSEKLAHELEVSKQKKIDVQPRPPISAVTTPAQEVKPESQAVPPPQQGSAPGSDTSATKLP